MVERVALPTFSPRQWPRPGGRSPRCASGYDRLGRHYFPGLNASYVSFLNSCAIVKSGEDDCFDEVAIQTELAYQRIDLPQAERHRRPAFQIPAYEPVLVDAQLQRRRAGVIHRGRAILLRQTQHSQDVAHGGIAIGLMQPATKCANLLACSLGAELSFVAG